MLIVQLPDVALVMSEQYPVDFHVPTIEPPHGVKAPHAARLPVPPDEPSQERETARIANSNLRMVFA
jgi:hypothetical protein